MTAQQFDPSKYKDGQRQDWDSVADAWKKWWPYFEQNMQQVSTALCDMAGIKPGDRVLDVSTGIGEPAVTVAGLVGPEGSVYATDQSPEMLRVARERVHELGLHNIGLVEADTETMELPEAEFDAAVCRWGLMFLPSPEEALRAISRSLKPGARFATSVWSTPENVQLISLPMAVAQKVLQPPPPPPPPDAPNLFKLGAPGLTESIFEQSGFKNVAGSVITVESESRSAEEYRDFIKDIAPPIRALVSERQPEEQDAYWDALVEAVKGRASADGSVKLRGDTILVVGTK